MAVLTVTTIHGTCSRLAAAAVRSWSSQASCPLSRPIVRGDVSAAFRSNPTKWIRPMSTEK